MVDILIVLATLQAILEITGACITDRFWNTGSGEKLCPSPILVFLQSEYNFEKHLIYLML